MEQDVSYALLDNKWFITPRQFHDNASYAGGLGLVWG
jgi:hypothetical protein